MAAVFDLDQVSVVRSGKTILDSITWTVEEGEHWVVLGPNGAGKSTLLQVLSASAHPSSGSAEILGEKLGSVSVFELRSRIGHTSTSVAEQIPSAESVRNVVLSAAHAVVGRWNENYDDEDYYRVDQLLAEMGITHLGMRTFGTLSEGEKKRVLIARALMTDPEAILLDEPGAGLDLGAREDLLSSLEVLSTDPYGAALVMVSHHVEEIATGFTHALLLGKATAVAQGPIAETLTSENLSQAFSQRLEVKLDQGRYTARRPPSRRRA